MDKKITYFSDTGETNTVDALKSASERLTAGDIKKVLIASTSGKSGVLAVKTLEKVQVLVVSHSYGFKKPNFQEMDDENRRAIEKAGGTILTCQHAFGGVGRAVRKKFGTYELEEIMAQTLRIFGEGTKVCVEMTLMACDAGLIDYGEKVLAVAGSDTGADTVLILKAANAQSCFDLRITEIVCKPLLD
jgi:hypothetical protein